MNGESKFLFGFGVLAGVILVASVVMTCFGVSSKKAPSGGLSVGAAPPGFPSAIIGGNGPDGVSHVYAIDPSNGAMFVETANGVPSGAQDAGASCVTLCTNHAIAIGCVNGYSNSLICNDGTNPIYVGAIPGLGAPGGLDAGTVPGIPIPGITSTLTSCVPWPGGVNAYCVTLTGQEQTNADAGTGSIGLR